MKFTYAWADIAVKNVTLKVATAILSLSLMVLTVATVKLATRDPLIIERACFNKVLSQSSTTYTNAEIEAFVREALAQRFNSDAVADSALLSDEEKNFRKAEQKNFANQSIKQSIIVNQIKVEEKAVQVNTDRLISVSQVRSAFMFPLTLTLAHTQRTPNNPYGLILSRVSEQKKEGGK